MLYEIKITFEINGRKWIHPFFNKWDDWRGFNTSAGEEAQVTNPETRGMW